MSTKEAGRLNISLPFSLQNELIGIKYEHGK